MAAVTGVSPNNAKVKATFANIRQSLPATPDIQAFLSSHQTSMAQLALQYCNVLVDDTAARSAFFGGAQSVRSHRSDQAPSRSSRRCWPRRSVRWDRSPTQPAEHTAYDSVGNALEGLMSTLCTSSTCTGQRALDVTKAACGAALGSATITVQ